MSQYYLVNGNECSEMTKKAYEECIKEMFSTVPNETAKDNKEMVNHPNHYNQGKYEVIDVIKDWKLDFNLGNAVKYIARCEHKGKYVEDLKKAMFYIQYAIDHMEEK